MTENPPIAPAIPLEKDIKATVPEATQDWAISVARGSQGELDITVSDIEAARHRIPALVAAQQTGLVLMEAGELSLEEVFVELVGGTKS